MLRIGSHDIPFPDVAMQVLNSIWPAVNIVERILLTGPILKVIACRKGAEPLYKESINTIRENRSKQFTNDAEAILSRYP